MVNHIGTWLFCARRSSEPAGGGNRCVGVRRCLADQTPARPGSRRRRQV